MSDPLDKIKEWRQVTDAATEGPWSAWEPGYEVQAGPNGRIASVTNGSDAEFIVTARTAMPRLITAVENVLKLHQPRAVQCIYGDCAAEMCDHEDIEDCPTKDFQQCVECDRLADEVSTYYSETQAYLTEWPCVTVTAIRDAIGGAE